MTCRFFEQQIHILLIFTLLLLSNCTSLYMPNVPSAAMLTKKSQLHVGGHISLKENVSINSAYAATDHFGLLLNASKVNQQKEKKDFKQGLIEVGAGYFTTFKNNRNRILEVYAGLGNGSTEKRIRENNSNQELQLTEDVRTNFNKVFLQVNYTSKKKRDLKIFGKAYPLNYGTILRMSYINMERFTINGNTAPTEDNIFLEPVFFTRLKLSQGLQIQYTSGSNFGLKSRKYLTAGNSIFTIGFTYNFNF